MDNKIAGTHSGACTRQSTRQKKGSWLVASNACDPYSFLYVTKQAMKPFPDPRLNRLIGALPPAEWLHLQPHLEWVDLPQGLVLHDPGQTVNHAYFPVDAMVSLMYLTEGGCTSELAVVGNDGMVGIQTLLGGEAARDQAVVHSPGQGFRLKASIIKDELRHCTGLTHSLLGYTQALITQIAQTAACSRHHTIEQRLAGRLLLSVDHLSGGDILMTQELISKLLGVRREGVTEAALKLQRAGSISYARGHIKVIDRTLLEKRCCECYFVVRKAYEHLEQPS